MEGTFGPEHGGVLRAAYFASLAIGLVSVALLLWAGSTRQEQLTVVALAVLLADGFLFRYLRQELARRDPAMTKLVRPPESVFYWPSPRARVGVFVLAVVLVEIVLLRIFGWIVGSFRTRSSDPGPHRAIQRRRDHASVLRDLVLSRLGIRLLYRAWSKRKDLSADGA